MESSHRNFLPVVAGSKTDASRCFAGMLELIDNEARYLDFFRTEIAILKLRDPRLNPPDRDDGYLARFLRHVMVGQGRDTVLIAVEALDRKAG
jgi:hypothetical protein